MPGQVPRLPTITDTYALRRKIAALSALLVATTSLVTACGSDEPEQHQQTHTAANGDTFNDADVTFATDMIQHHAQALKMVDMTMGRDVDPEVAQLAEEIRTAQVAEVETMVDWLTAWEKPVPETVQDHANAHGDGELEMDEMPGMLTGEQLDELEAARGAEFRRMWLEMMVEHHQGAVEMATTEASDGEFDDAVAMARSVQSSQQDEIDRMEKLLGS